MEHKEALGYLVEYCDIVQHKVNRFVAGEAFNNNAIALSLENIRLFLEEFHESIN
jgi:hypothetical protein